ncbi:hypothetical protein RISK_000977 [Rhodopirellula islandica]|uniref:Uncharacterized protein n=1 Tax=Rhodopirellula islandica TaxID=595434 RepID=A0A0J1BKX0_RHOIS|nr:hypothetical protein RISK_000977 [Rhodopirellula islandica]
MSGRSQPPRVGCVVGLSSNQVLKIAVPSTDHRNTANRTSGTTGLRYGTASSEAGFGTSRPSRTFALKRLRGWLTPWNCVTGTTGSELGCDVARRWKAARRNS